MAQSYTWMVYLLYTCISVRQVFPLQECCVECNDPLETLSRQQWRRIASSSSQNETCDFRFRPSVDRDFIRIQTTKFELLDSVGCLDEYVEIFDDRTVHTDSDEGRLFSIGRWCGKSYARQVDIWGSVRIRFKNGGSTGDPFSITVISMPENFFTGQEHHDTIRLGPDPVYIYSPGYPVRYPSNLKMNWNVIGQDSSKLINVEAVEFQLEGAGDSGVCSTDFLSLSTIPRSNESDVWCGRNGSRFLQSHNNVELNFRTNKREEYGGFALRIYTTPPRNTSCLRGGKRDITAHTRAEVLSFFHLPNERAVCSWLIMAEHLYDVIQLEVIIWDEDVLACRDRPLQIHDGADDTGIRLVSKCGGASPFGFIRTSGSTVYITSGLVISQSEATKQRFKIKYTTIYKYYYEDEYHEAVKSRSYMWIPALNSAVSRPDIKFRSDSPSDRCVHIEVQTKWLHQMTGSFMDYMDVYDGSSPNGRMMGVCSGGDKSSISGTRDTLRVKIKTSVREGFWLTVDTTSNCDGDTETLRVTSTDQRLSFPTARMKLNRFYPSNTVCKWRLVKSIDAGLVHLDVLDLHLTNPYPGNCGRAVNFLTVYDGKDSASSMMDTWCDDHVSNVTSLRNIWLEVSVKDRLSDRKFTVSYWMENQFTCSDVTLSARSEWAHLNSPGFPSYYPNNISCSWSIISENPAHHVKLEVIEINTHNCIDVATVYDGLSRQFPYQRLCGEGYTTSNFESTGRSLSVTFHSDFVHSDKGFKLAYYSVGSTTGPGPSRIILTATHVEQALRSPNYPVAYERGIDRSWLIKADSPSSVVTLKLVLTGNMLPCRSKHDTLTVYDGPNTAASVLGYICTDDENRVPITTYQSHGDSVFLHLVSADSSHDQGYTGIFQIDYTSGRAQRACLPDEVEELTAGQYWKYLKFPSHNGDYPNNADCRWRIATSNRSGMLSVEVTETDMEVSYTCAYDRVTVYDGYNEASTEIGVFCGEQTPEYQSTGQFMYLVFNSDAVTEKGGFHLRYRVTPSTDPTDETPAKDQSVGLLVGGTLGGVVLLLIAITCFLCILGRTKRSAQTAQPREPVVYNRNNSTVYVVSPVIVGGASSLNSAPPPYPGISNPAYSASPSDDLPPSYHEYTSPERQQPATPGGENNHLYHLPSHDASSIPSPPPYSESHATDLPESPPAYEAAISSGSPTPLTTGADNSASVVTPSRQLPPLSGSDSRGDNTTSPRSQKYEVLGPV